MGGDKSMRKPYQQQHHQRYVSRNSLEKSSNFYGRNQSASTTNPSSSRKDVNLKNVKFYVLYFHYN